MSNGDRPTPLIEPHTAPYWDAAAEHRFVIQRCEPCTRWIHPPLHACPICGNEALGFEAASGRGRIHGFTVSHMSGGPGFETTPYAVVVVELAEQPGLLTVGNVLNAEPGELAVGQEVSVVFEDVAGVRSLPQWELVR